MSNSDELLAHTGGQQPMVSFVDRSKAELEEIVRYFYQMRWAPATSGNYSFRLPGHPDFYISASGIDKSKFKASDFIHVHSDGTPIDDPRKVSAETLIHSTIYELHSHVNCILHTHSIHNTVMTAAFGLSQAFMMEGYELMKGFKGLHSHKDRLYVPMYLNTQDMKKLRGQLIEEYDKDNKAPGFFIEAHGIYSWGETIEDAKRHTETFEFLLEVMYKLRLFQK